MLRESDEAGVRFVLPIGLGDRALAVDAVTGPVGFRDVYRAIGEHLFNKRDVTVSFVNSLPVSSHIHISEANGKKNHDHFIKQR